MSNDVIKNPLQSIPQIQEPYEPEYVRRGIKVSEAPSNMSAGVLGSTKKRDPNPPINTESIFSIDQTLDENGTLIPLEGGLIDNNDYVDLGYFSAPIKKPKEDKTPIKENPASPNVGDYILMVLGKLITIGSSEKIEAMVKQIMYGEDKDFAGLEISMDDIVVLKRLAIKVGIFIDK